MIDVADIKYPVKFHFFDIPPKYIIFWSKGSKGVYETGTESDFSINYFVDNHNRVNPTNKPGARYYCEYFRGEIKPKLDRFYSGGFFGSSIVSATASNDAINSDAVKSYGAGKAEDIPIGATLLKIKSGDGWDEMRFKVRRIEIHDGIVTLLSGYGGLSKKEITYTAEINIKRDTTVTWQE